MEERTGWRGQNESQIVGEEKKNGRLVGAVETSKERAEWRRLQRKNWNKLGLPKRKEWSQCHRESSWQERRSRPYQKEQSRLPKAPDYEGGSEREHGVERVDFTVKEGRFQGGQVVQARIAFPRRGRRKHERVSGRKSSSRRFAESWFHS